MCFLNYIMHTSSAQVPGVKTVLWMLPFLQLAIINTSCETKEQVEPWQVKLYTFNFRMKSSYLKFSRANAVQLDSGSCIPFGVKQPYLRPFKWTESKSTFHKVKTNWYCYLSRGLWVVMLHISEGKMMQILSGLDCKQQIWLVICACSLWWLLPQGD